MRIRLWRLGLSLLWLATARADDSLRVLVNDAFGPGESLEFSVGYGLVEAGTYLAIMDCTPNSVSISTWICSSLARSNLGPTYTR